MNDNNLIKAYNYKENNNYTQEEPKKDFLINNCNENFNLDKNANNLDIFFNQESPYKLPPLIIRVDNKNINQSEEIYQKYMDVITDECGNRFNIRNQNSSAGILQAGYSANIDLDSHLKNINYYADKCYYDNFKLAPNSEILTCNGLKRNAKILIPDYTFVGRNYKDCIGISINNHNNNKFCWNTPPTDINNETNVRKRYDFSSNKFQGESCIKPEEWKYFQKADNIPLASTLEKYPNGIRNEKVINNLNNPNNNIQHDFYKFFESNQCVIYPNQRLFNNITKRSMLPNQHFHNISPIYLTQQQNFTKKNT
jgi:hypothetical protein